MTDEPKHDALVPVEQHPHAGLTLPDILKRATGKDFVSAALIRPDHGERNLPATIGTLACFGCDQRYTPLTFRDHPAFGGARLCPDCRSGKNRVLESWTMEDGSEREDYLELPDAPAQALEPKDAITKALAILALEVTKLAPARASALLSSYVEFQDPAVRAVLERPREALEALMGRGPRAAPREAKAEARTKSPPGLPPAEELKP